MLLVYVTILIDGYLKKQNDPLELVTFNNENIGRGMVCVSLKKNLLTETIDT